MLADQSGKLQDQRWFGHYENGCCFMVMMGMESQSHNAQPAMTAFKPLASALLTEDCAYCVILICSGGEGSGGGSGWRSGAGEARDGTLRRHPFLGPA